MGWGGRKTGVPAGVARVLGQSGAAASVTGTLVETTLATITIPGGTMKKNGLLRVTTLWTLTNSGNSKTFKVKLGATAFLSISQSAQASFNNQTIIRNRNAQNSQVAMYPAFANTFGVTTSANTTGAIDTSVDQTLTITGTLANTGETITLEAYTVEVLPGLD